MAEKTIIGICIPYGGGVGDTRWRETLHEGTEGRDAGKGLGSTEATGGRGKKRELRRSKPSDPWKPYSGSSVTKAKTKRERTLDSEGVKG